MTEFDIGPARLARFLDERGRLAYVPGGALPVRT